MRPVDLRLEHARHEAADAVHHAHQVDAQRPLPVLEGGRPRGSRHAHARVVEDEVRGAEALPGASARRLDRRRFETSQRCVSTAAPSGSTQAPGLAPCRARRCRRARDSCPSPAQASASARPMPLPAPVITAILPRNSSMVPRRVPRFGASYPIPRILAAPPRGGPMLGLMQDRPLLISSIIEHAGAMHADARDRLAHGRRAASTAARTRDIQRRSKQRGERARGARRRSPATASRRWRGTATGTSSSISASRAWARCCTRSIRGSSPSRSPTSSTTPRTRSCSSTSPSRRWSRSWRRR